jgi:hypothetical protein
MICMAYRRERALAVRLNSLFSLSYDTERCRGRNEVNGRKIWLDPNGREGRNLGIEQIWI